VRALRAFWWGLVALCLMVEAYCFWQVRVFLVALLVVAAFGFVKGRAEVR
jgi:hypothetical protein